jgi:hypothetical protein
MTEERQAEKTESLHDDTVSTERKSQDPEIDGNATPDVEPPSEAPIIEEQPNYSIFTTWEKRGIILGSATGALLSPLTAQIYLPSLNLLASDLNVSISQINLTVTTYMVRNKRLAPAMVNY